MAPWQKALAACANDLGSLPAATMKGSQLLPVISVPGDLTSPSGLHIDPYACVHTNILIHTYKH